MNTRILIGNVNITFKKFSAILLLFLSTFSWFYFIYSNYKFSANVDIGYQVLGFRDTSFVLGEAIFLSSIAISAILGSAIGERYSRRKLFFYWTVFGVAATVLAWIFEGTPISFFSTALLGASFGFCFPLVISYMSDSTRIEERGRVSGIIIFTSFIIAVFTTTIAPLMGTFLLAIILRSLGFIALVLDPCNRSIEKLKTSWSKILTHKQFAYYILPFLMFSVLSGILLFIQIPDSTDYKFATDIGNVLHILGAGLFALIAGFLADKVGRRKPVIVGLVLLGISCTLLGFALSSITWIIFLAVSGGAWGIVFAIYFAIPGDLAFSGAQERFYALGTVVPFIAYMTISGMAEWLGLRLQVSSLSPILSILSIVLFVSIVPLLYASETLPESKIADKKIADHLEKVRKVIDESKRE